MVPDRSSETEFEVKVGLVFDGARRVGRTRGALTGRTYVGGTGSRTTFAERFELPVPPLISWPVSARVSSGDANDAFLVLADEHYHG